VRCDAALRIQPDDQASTRRGQPPSKRRREAAPGAANASASRPSPSVSAWKARRRRGRRTRGGREQHEPRARGDRGGAHAEAGRLTAPSPGWRFAPPHATWRPGRGARRCRERRAQAEAAALAERGLPAGRERRQREGGRRVEEGAARRARVRPSAGRDAGAQCGQYPQALVTSPRRRASIRPTRRWS
jgi:hypothetical protein